ncbi:hypothetical protein LEP1GSC060_0219 [Leptospira weilii serovar Ranarum str. ICFT]|uniref:Uncharacterized protein n=1 Tax=Leptospira weilii serovar Ranarum str. ICFT TaxID=1218598 RepID=N1WGH6_9LEPT|nr:hypothetical protein [Leptospira weilii]EMY76427.1 hypothetical protein LEP1GSC060_0219 [Leptospira weilii serovar Ranarum str. ICFT]
MKPKSISKESQADDSADFLFWQITNLRQKRIRENLSILDLTHFPFVLLASLARFEETSQKAAQVRLAKHTKTEVPCWI